MSPMKHIDYPEGPNQFCHLLNISQCHLTEASNQFIVNVYNPLIRTCFQDYSPTRITKRTN